MAKPADKKTAIRVLRKLHEAGHQAYFAGGCVRDMLLGDRAEDYDVATDATPQQVKKIFPRVLMVGAKFGVTMVLVGGRKVEVTTFRSDLSYDDGRRPAGVDFTSAKEDALRRDFTINGMFYDPLAKRIVDYVGGRDDLKKGVIRTIGRADMRFAEDYLRMMRAVRFAARLKFKIAPSTAAAIKKHAHKITLISGERILDEISRMLARRSAPDALEMLEKLNLAPAALPELFDPPDLWPEGFARAGALAARRDWVLTLGGLLAGLDAPQAGRIARRWGASNRLRAMLCKLADKLDLWRDAASLPLCEFKRLLADEDYRRLLALWRVEEERLAGARTQYRRIAARAGAIPKDKIAPPPLVTGRDLIKMGYAQGPRIGRTLKKLYDAQLNEQITTRRAALEKAREMKKDS